MTSLDQEILNAEALCRSALNSEYRDLAGHLTDAPQDPKAWFRLLRSLAGNPGSARKLERLCSEAERRGYRGGTVERYAVLQSYLEALPLISGLPVHESINEQYCATCRRIASRSEWAGGHFNRNSDAFDELARIVTLTRYHAGQVSFDVMAMPRAWLLKVHPLAIPSVLHEVLAGMGGLGPILMPHLNYWRNIPLVMLERENARSFWRIIKSMERQPEIKGLVASSWMYSAAVGEVSPHMAWMRDFYARNGAYLVDMEPAPERAGFLVGSDLRRKLYVEGKFRPRQTLVLWRRADMLAWREAYENPGRGVAAEKARSRVAVPSRTLPCYRSDANRTLSSGQMTLVNLESLLTSKPRQYIFYVFVIPCLLAAIVASVGVGLWAVAPAVVSATAVIWLFQYFFLQ